MNYQEAKALLIREGLSEASAVIQCRMMEDPGPERMSSILNALSVASSHTAELAELDRELCLAIWALSYHCDTQSEAWRNERLENEVIELVQNAELFFQGNLEL